MWTSVSPCLKAIFGEIAKGKDLVGRLQAGLCLTNQATSRVGGGVGYPRLSYLKG